MSITRSNNNFSGSSEGDLEQAAVGDYCWGRRRQRHHNKELHGSMQRAKGSFSANHSPLASSSNKKSSSSSEPAALDASSSDNNAVINRSTVQELSNRLGAARLLEMNFADYEPTETEITETEEISETEHHEVEQQHKNENNNVATATMSTPLLPLSELVDRLAQVNASMEEHESSSSSFLLDQKLQRRRRSMSFEEITKILRHINLCESSCSNTEIRWDLVDEIVYDEKAIEHDDILFGDHDDDNEYENHHDLASGGEDDDDDDDDDDSIQFEQLQRELIQAAADGDDDASDGFTLDASSQSCGSSVTWFEGSQIEEVEVTDDDDEDSLGDLLSLGDDSQEAASIYFDSA